MTNALRRFRTLDLTVTRRLDGRLQGDYEGRRLGPGGEREEVTLYRPGDDPRRIDWNATARTGEPHVWRTRADHELESWVLVDASASMAFGTTDREKADIAVEVGAAVGLLTDRPGNRLGVLHVTADGLRWSAPLPGRRAAHRALALPSGARTGAPPADLAHAIAALDRRVRRPGLRVLVSDLLPGELDNPTDPVPWQRPLARLAARHEVLVVQIVDPRELDLPAVGHVVLVDPESGRQREFWTGDRRLRERFAHAVLEHQQRVDAALRASGCDYLTLRTDRDWSTDLARHLAARRRRPARRKKVSA